MAKYIIRNDELYHHGIKGQKWGVRRYQNSDGSLTDEGYRHYGYGKRGLFAPNTSEKIKKGVKIGTGIGVATGLATAGATAALTAGVLAPATIVAIGAAQLATWTTEGAITGLEYGAIAGAISTKAGRNYIENNPNLKTKISDFQKREFSN